MPNEHKKYRDQFFNAMNGLADSVFEMSDEEIEAELKGQEDDAEEIRNVLLSALKAYQLQDLREAKERYEQNLQSFRITTFDLPSTPTEKRNLIQSILGGLTQGQQLVTAQFRDFENMPDEDLDGVLLQLLTLKSNEDSEE